MKTKVLFLILAISVAIFISGCGGEEEQKEVKLSPEKSRIAFEEYHGVIATPEAFEDVFGKEEFDKARKYKGIVATTEDYQAITGKEETELDRFLREHNYIIATREDYEEMMGLKNVQHDARH